MATLRQLGLSLIILAAVLNSLAWRFNKQEKELLDEERRTGWTGLEPSDFWYLKYTQWLKIGGIIAALAGAILIFWYP